MTTFFFCNVYLKKKKEYLNSGSTGPWSYRLREETGNLTHSMPKNTSKCSPHQSNIIHGISYQIHIIRVMCRLLFIISYHCRCRDGDERNVRYCCCCFWLFLLVCLLLVISIFFASLSV